MLKVRAGEPRSTVRRRVRRIGLFVIPPGVTALVLAFYFPSSCAGPLMREVTATVLADAIAPQVTIALGALRSVLFASAPAEASTRATQQVGQQFAEELARNHHYWCDSRESKQACINRIAPLAAADVSVILKRWDQSVDACRREVNEHPNPQSDEIRAVDEFFACMEKQGYERQIATLRAAGSRST